jgi:hypothetical protein
MRELALSDEILLSIEKPARYIGNEVNSVVKNKDKVDIRLLCVFQMSMKLECPTWGMGILYDMFNRRDDIYCERVFSPWVDLDKIMREQKIPLFALGISRPFEEL